MTHSKDGVGFEKVPYIQAASDSPRVFLASLKIGDFVFIKKAPESPGDTGITEEAVVEYDLTAIKGGRAIFEVKHRGFTCD